MASQAMTMQTMIGARPQLASGGWSGAHHHDPGDDGAVAATVGARSAFTFNIAISVIVLLVAMATLKPLDFSIFPTILLVTTLLRLSLNVASTPRRPAEWHTGPGCGGKVIEAFGHFLVGGNYAVASWSSRFSSSSTSWSSQRVPDGLPRCRHRFTLDAMPGNRWQSMPTQCWP